jgi:SpoVK/Ycf46/Vps4 family AAA+-type ATPase
MLATGLLGTVSLREVYRVDFSSLISKYLGKTERNLAAFFETTWQRDGVLFFDEAGAAFN